MTALLTAESEAAVLQSPTAQVLLHLSSDKSRQASLLGLRGSTWSDISGCSAVTRAIALASWRSASTLRASGRLPLPETSSNWGSARVMGRPLCPPREGPGGIGFSDTCFAPTWTLAGSAADPCATRGRHPADCYRKVACQAWARAAAASRAARTCAARPARIAFRLRRSAARLPGSWAPDRPGALVRAALDNITLRRLFTRPRERKLRSRCTLPPFVPSSGSTP